MIKSRTGRIISSLFFLAMCGALSYNISGKGKLSLTLLKVESRSEFEISALYFPEREPPLEVKTLLMDGQNLLKGQPADWLSLFIPIPKLFPVFSSLNFTELEEKKRMEIPLENSYPLVVTWKEKKENRITVAWNYEERKKLPLLPPRVYLSGGNLAQIPLVRNYTGEAEFSADGVLNSLKIKIRITEDYRTEGKPAPTPEGEKKSEQPPSSAPSEGKRETPPSAPGTPGTGEAQPKEGTSTSAPPSSPPAKAEESKPGPPQPPATSSPPASKKTEPIMGFTYEFVADYSFNLVEPSPSDRGEEKDVSVSGN
ncbi:MAG: hypothetical protein V2G48_04265 [bacterium JZ-2024 1]